jgi:hypothetical protein
MQILQDFLIPGTPLRGLILHSGFCLCAYLGVPKDHWVADMEGLSFECHRGITFRGEGSDIEGSDTVGSQPGAERPRGWFWYGWDYAHAGDAILPLDDPRLPESLRETIREIGSLMPRGKRWSVEEVALDVIDAALNLNDQLERTRFEAEQTIKTIARASRYGSPR